VPYRRIVSSSKSRTRLVELAAIAGRPGRPRSLLVFAVYAIFTALQAYWSGISALTLCYLAVALYFALEAVRGGALGRGVTVAALEKRRIGSKQVLVFLVVIAAGVRASTESRIRISSCERMVSSSSSCQASRSICRTHVPAWR
jgi:hypothetical protein